uniref:Replication protein VP4 n=1 Tax=Gokushovirinae environmental samples TaxID=1478972 RepID=A0A2R3UAP2_9VIRU|nr:replication protein VP4 [Gokushovirinae environmental samples]
MPCYSPLTAYRDAGGGITFNRNASPSAIALKLPCGQCVGCRLERSRQWAVRCVHEAKMHERNCVVTLTYNDAHLPDDGGLVKRHLQLFMKRLRKEFGNGIRFYACGEYGENTKRPHYHCILFNFDFADKRFYKKSKTGDNLYTSDTAERVWAKGFCVVGEVTFESCAYIARYIVDKMTGEKADEWYTTNDGVIVQSEFTNMSRRPGIGRSYYDKYGAEVLRHDSVIIRAMPVRPPRYYDVLSEAVDPKRMAVIKRKRQREALKHLADNSPERRRVKETVAVLNLNMWKRNVS